MATVKLEHVSKQYPGGHPAVTDLSLDVLDGEFLVLVGPSGCGKSTALRMIAGLEEVSSGTVSIGGRVVNDLAPRDRDVAMVFQSDALYPHMTVQENLGFALKLAKTPKGEIEQAVTEAARTLDLTELLQRKPAALSGGERQRVAMGRAIVRNPAVFLMDEPLSNLDARLRVQMRAEIASLQDRLDVTTIYVTHDQVEAMTMGDRVAVLDRGILQQVDAPQRLYDLPDNLFVAGFIGSPAMNLMEGEVERDGDALAVRIGTTTIFPIPPPAIERHPGIRKSTGRRVAVGMRPEHFFVATSATTPATTWEGRQVTLVEQLGSEALVHFATSAAPLGGEIRAGNANVLTARVAPHDAPATGEVVDLGFDTTKLHFFDLQTGAALR